MRRPRAEGGNRPLPMSLFYLIHWWSRVSSANPKATSVGSIAVWPLWGPCVHLPRLEAHIDRHTRPALHGFGTSRHQSSHLRGKYFTQELSPYSYLCMPLSFTPRLPQRATHLCFHSGLEPGDAK